ncbi:hypothetical protein Lesp02_53340 [Lentzea sp. NBRC 105346]|uniref:hypothetical protein n=1 Tax=Lentzea sp. NBRC 105346 TaxID=3032205 RepID=UPI0024A026E3|nr:hypothetical protein [Lentzea sp. NBRC 105346]GLZ33146.1 hypothetical protein Lesp02_53340 [Lentzea sp. NBRC 105346]
MPGLRDELRRLRKGRGVLAADIDTLAGNALRALCGITPQDSQPVIRQKVTDELKRLADRLQPDLKLAALAALAIHPEAQQTKLTERVEWLAQAIGKQTRTARRRADDAIELLVQAAENRPGDEGWYVQAFEAQVRLDMGTPEVVERRKIVATRDGVDAIVPALSLPRHRADQRVLHDVNAKVLYGGKLVQQEHPSESYFRFTIELPEPLHSGQTHEYAMKLRVPDGQPMRPHYVFSPHRRCDRFSVRIQFDVHNPPRSVWLVSRTPMRMVDDATPCGELLSVDASGAVQVEFDELDMGFGYGVQWRWAGGPAPAS